MGSSIIQTPAVNPVGKPLLETACGLANAEWDAANTITTRFRIASITREFTAAEMLLLQEDRKLSVTDTVGKYVDRLL